MSAAPLAGRRIIVTRARHQAGGLTARLAELGAEVIELPAIEIVPPESYAPLDAALRNLSQYQFLIVTSINTAHVLSERREALGIRSDAFAPLKVVAIGRSTAAAMKHAGIHVDITPDRYVGEALAEALADRVRGKRVLLARASVARDIVPEELIRCGAIIEIVDAYRTVMPQASVKRLRELTEAGGSQPVAVTFTSSSTVANFFRLLAEAGRESPPAGLRAFSIGPVTSATLREHAWEPSAEATQHDMDGLVKIILQVFSG